MRYWKERKIHGKPVVSMAAAVYLDSKRQRDVLLGFVYDFLSQTYPYWQLLLVHDGPCHLEIKKPLEHVCDSRVKWIETSERKKNFGHPWRRGVLLNHGTGQYVGFTNFDNRYVPVYLEWMVSELQSHKADFAYCDMVHSHKLWKLMQTKPSYKHLDLGDFLTTMDLVRATPWNDFSFRGDGTYINLLVSKAKKVVKVPAVLFTHN